MYSLNGQVAIITGGARGIGKGICEVFCKAGAKVALWDVLDEGNHTANQIKKEGGSIFFQKVDITNKSSVEEAVSKIISASSINAFQGAFGQANYSATKAGISGFTRALCKEGGKYGITVNAVAPGFIKSLMSDSMPEEIIKAGIAQIPVGRIGTPEDMGYTYLFLASKEAGFISGITLHANGGAMPM